MQANTHYIYNMETNNITAGEEKKSLSFVEQFVKEDFSGSHNFAKDYQEHLKNAVKYTKALNERGIK